MSDWLKRSWSSSLTRSLGRSLGVDWVENAAEQTPASLAMERLRVATADALAQAYEGKVLLEKLACLREHTTDAAFFEHSFEAGLGGDPNPLYEPIRLERVGKNDPSGAASKASGGRVPDSFTDLWYHQPDSEDKNAPRPGLLQWLQDKGDPRGVLLVARSGSGKTTAQRYAAHQMLGAFSPANPRIPVWLDALPKDWGGGSVLALLAHMTGGPPASPDYLRHALRQTPVTVFCDLNAMRQAERMDLAKALVKFQEEFGPSGSRVVAVYRAVSDDEPVMETLIQDKQFLRFRQANLTPGAATKYIHRFEAYSRALRDKLGLENPNLPIDKHELNAFIVRYAGGHDPMISTPLLMHFVATLAVAGVRPATDKGRPDDAPVRLSDIHTAMDLYDRVVDSYLDREAHANDRRPDCFAGDPGKTRSRILLTRFALAVLGDSDREDAQLVALSEEQMDDVLNPHPRRGRPASWVPTDDWWREAECLYYTNGQDKGLRDLAAALDAKTQATEWLPLRRTAQGYQLIHDSFLYYFAAKSLVEFERPGKPRIDQLHGYPDWPATNRPPPGRPARAVDPAGALPGRIYFPPAPTPGSCESRGGFGSLDRRRHPAHRTLGAPGPARPARPAGCPD